VQSRAGDERGAITIDTQPELRQATTADRPASTKGITVQRYTFPRPGRARDLLCRSDLAGCGEIDRFTNCDTRRPAGAGAASHRAA